MLNSSIKARLVHSRGTTPVHLELDREGREILSVSRLNAPPENELYIFPGFVDIHVHAREYASENPEDSASKAALTKMTAKETFCSAGLAALNGGVTMYGAMPNDPEPPKDQASYQAKVNLAAQSPCPVIVFGCVCPDSSPWEQIPYKVYLDAVSSVNTFSSWRDLETTLARFTAQSIFFHAEDPEILRANTVEGPRWLTRSPMAEVVAVERILEYTHRYGLRTHICHVSTKAALNLIDNYNRRASRRVTCEVTPHHLSFSFDNGSIYCAINEDRIHDTSMLGSNPPIRSEEDRRFTLDCLRTGIIDILASDHAPHTIEDKVASAAGLPHLDTMGPFAGWLINTQGFSPERIAAAYSTTPAMIMGREMTDTQDLLSSAGSSPTITILDLSRGTEAESLSEDRGGMLMTKCGWTPYNGMTLPAATHSVFIDGIRKDPRLLRMD